MDVEVLDRAKEQCTGTGTTGNLTLASVSYDGFNTFSDQLLDGVTVDVLVVDSDASADGWEVLRCSYTLATKVLNRSSGTVLASSNSGNSINLSANTHSVGIVNSALRIVENRDFVAVHSHVLADVTDSGTAASHDVSAAGDAAADEVVLGDDTRLVSQGIYMSVLLYDPTGIGDNVFDIANQTGNFDAGVFT